MIFSIQSFGFGVGERSRVLRCKAICVASLACRQLISPSTAEMLHIFTSRGKFLSDYNSTQGLRWPVHTMWKVFIGLYFQSTSHILACRQLISPATEEMFQRPWDSQFPKKRCFSSDGDSKYLNMSPRVSEAFCNQVHKETILPPWDHVFEGDLIFLSILMVPSKYESI